MIKQPYMRWTQDTETAFLLALKATGTVRAAADAVGRCVGSAYKRRQRRPEFRERWDAMVAEWQAQWIEQRGTKVADSQVALLALDKQGRAGAFALQPGFTYAVTDAAGRTRIERAGALFSA